MVVSRRQITVLCGIQFVDVLGVTSAITALPAMLDGVSAPAGTTAVLATVYAMFFGGLLVLGARLGDRYGHRHLLIIGCVAFALVSAIGATAQEAAQLIAARALQGAAAAISVPPALRLLLEATPDPGDRRGALAAWSAAGAAAGAAGLLVGGVLTDLLDWRAVFWVNVPLGVGLAIAVRLVISRSAAAREPSRLDLSGAALLTGAVMALIVGASLVEDPHQRPAAGLLIIAGLMGGAGFIAHQRRAEGPLVPRAAYASANLRLGTAVSFVNTATTGSAAVLATLVMQRELGMSAIGAGVALLPLSLGVVAGSTLAKPLGARLKPRRLSVAGLAGIAGGNVVLALTYGRLAGIVTGAVLIGAGLGVASVAGNAIGTDVHDSLAGTASGVLNTGAQLGTALGVAALLLVAAAGAALAWGAAAAVAGLTALKLLRTD
jgi:MFS family permease